MFARIAKLCSPVLIALAFAITAPAPSHAAEAVQSASGEGIVKVKSAYSMEETIARLKADIAKKGIMFFTLVEQSKLAAAANIKLGPSALLIFGNPALGSLLLTSNPLAGIDWPVRLLVVRDEAGQVWAVYSDFGYIARRYHIEDRAEAFKMASSVIASITSSVAAK